MLIMTLDTKRMGMVMILTKSSIAICSEMLVGMNFPEVTMK